VRDFSGKVALVTGASRGIGREIALALAGDGAHIVAVDVNEPLLAETANQIEAKGVKALTIKADVTRSEEVDAAVEKAVATHGLKRR